MNDSNNNSDRQVRSLEWLIEQSEERTNLPRDLLRMWVEHLTLCRGSKNHYFGHIHNNDASSQHDRGSDYSARLNRICQKGERLSRVGLLDMIWKERHAMRTWTLARNMLAAKKLVDFFGPLHWKPAVGLLCENGIGICPNIHCGMLLCKDGGCPSVRCFCGLMFEWWRADLDAEDVMTSCDAIARNIDVVLLKRVLLIAEHIVVSAIESKKRHRKNRRPVLHTEDMFDIMEAVRYQQQPASRFEDEEQGQRYCNLSPKALSRESNVVARGTNESSVATHSLCDEYIIVSDADESRSGSGSNESDLWEECSSYSVLSGCETVHSLDDSNDTNVNAHTGERTTMMSYCKAVKLGISVGKKARESPMEGAVMVMTTSTSSRTFPHIRLAVDDPDSHKELSEEVSARTLVFQKEYRDQKIGKQEGDRPEDSVDDDDNDAVLSIYDGAKSGHGGRSSLRFRGNCRTQCSYSGDWGYPRRPNWSRKRRKNNKNRL